MNDNIKIIKKIGRGSFSNCYLCRNENKLVAIKKSKIDNFYEGIKSCELKEIYCLLELIGHVNIIPLYEISFNESNEYILIMKYVKMTLYDFVDGMFQKDKYLINSGDCFLNKT